MPWMSTLLGPLSEMISRVSWRDWALAGDHTAGAGSALPAATAAADFRKSRRFIAHPRCNGLSWLRSKAYAIAARRPDVGSERTEIACRITRLAERPSAAWKDRRPGLPFL